MLNRIKGFSRKCKKSLFKKAQVLLLSLGITSVLEAKMTTETTKRAQSPLFPDYYCNDRRPNNPTNSENSKGETQENDISSHEIDPSLQQLDNQRRADIAFPQLDSKGRPTFTAIIADAAKLPGHNLVKERIRDIVQNKKVSDYSQYLANVRQDLTVIEVFLITEKIPPSLPSLYRSKALVNDIINLNMSSASNLGPHYDYFAAQIESPHLLVGHYAVHLLGLLADGKHIAKRITEIWGEKSSTQFYQFEGDTEQLRTKFKQELNDYAANMSDAQIQELQTELKKIWPMVGDLLGIDIREKK
jgi:hypothetical protein